MSVRVDLLWKGPETNGGRRRNMHGEPIPSPGDVIPVEHRLSSRTSVLIQGSRHSTDTLRWWYKAGYTPRIWY